MEKLSHTNSTCTLSQKYFYILISSNDQQFWIEDLCHFSEHIISTHLHISQFRCGCSMICVVVVVVVIVCICVYVRVCGVCVYVCVCVCVCVFVCNSIHSEGFICLDQLDYQGTDQWCCVEDVYFLCYVLVSLL